MAAVARAAEETAMAAGETVMAAVARAAVALPADSSTPSRIEKTRSSN